jgi:hypothetical protein
MEGAEYDMRHEVVGKTNQPIQNVVFSIYLYRQLQDWQNPWNNFQTKIKDGE